MIRVVGGDWNYLHGRYGGVQNGKEEPGERRWDMDLFPVASYKTGSKTSG